MKPLNELVFEDESALFIIKQWIFESNNCNRAVILPSFKEQGEKELFRLQVTTKSSLGAVAYSTGGILLQNGWLRVLGSGHDNLPRTITSWTEKCKLDNVLLVADDVIGGFFALNGGYFDEGKGEIFYLAPDTLAWECLEMGYTDFLNWACTGDLSGFYEPFRWNKWETIVPTLDGNQGISIYPYLWSNEAKESGIEKCSKKAVPLEELWGLNLHYREKLGTE